MSPFPSSFAAILRKAGKKAHAFFINQSDITQTREEQILKYRQFQQSLKDKIVEDLTALCSIPVYSDFKRHRLLHPTSWVVDLICGEKNFLSGLHPFALMLTEFVDGQPYSVALFDPYSDELTTAAVDRGSFCELRKLKIHPKTHCDLSFTNSPMSAYLLTQTGCTQRMYGCMEMEIAWLCQGKSDLCFYENADLHPGLRLLIQESGGSCFTSRVCAESDDRTFCAIGHKLTIQSILKAPAISKLFAGQQWLPTSIFN